MLVTFDFDSTLTRPVKESFAWQDTSFWDTSTEPREDILERLREFASEGHEVHIVTTRDRTNSEEVVDFVNEHSLPVTGIHFTGGDDKLPTLQGLGSELHFDDDFNELKRLDKAGIDHRLVPHPHDQEHRPEELEGFPTV
jgi:uncharacterized HAD superfamily protein